MNLVVWCAAEKAQLVYQTSSKGIHAHGTSTMSSCQGAGNHTDKIQAHQDVPLENIDPHGSLKWVLLSCVFGDAAHLVQIIACWLLIKQGDASCTLAVIYLA